MKCLKFIVWVHEDGMPPSFSLADADFCVLHSPFVKMVRKAFARLVYQDHLRAKSRHQALQAQPSFDQSLPSAIL